MFEIEEKQLNELNQVIRDIPEPDNINEYIKRGLLLGIKKKKNNTVKLFANIAAALIMVIFIVSVRTIPVMAEYMSKIPGLGYLVDLINYDKGLKSAIDNNFIQHINLSQTHDGITFTISDVILDNSKSIIFYSIKHDGTPCYVLLDDVKFLDDNNNILKAVSSWNYPPNDNEDKTSTHNNKIELDFNDETLLPDNIKIEITLKQSDIPYIDPNSQQTKLAPVWKFQLPVDKAKINRMQSTYLLNKSISIEGQTIQFKQVDITPTRIAVKIEYDKNNSKKIFRYDDIKLIDEKGEEWGNIINGISSARKDENHEILYFQSNYFNTPKELYLQGTSLRALDKDKCTVQVDIEKGTLISAPDNKLTLDGISSSDHDSILRFNLKVDNPFDNNYVYHLFEHEFRDSNNKLLMADNTGTNTSINGAQQQINFSIKSDLKIKNPIYLTLEDYPKRITGSFKIKIK